MTDTDLEIEYLREAQSGDYDAFEALYESLYPSVWRFVARLVGDIDDVDDIVQNTFIALYQNLHRIDPVENLRPYVFRMARNRSTDVLRQQGRYEITTFDEETAGQTRLTFSGNAYESKPEDVVHWLLIRMDVMDAIERLPEHQRQALILYAEEHLSMQEIAIAMDTSVGTVKSRLFHARKTLRGLLSKQTLQAVDAVFQDEAPPADRSDTAKQPDIEADEVSSQEQSTIEKESIE